MRMMSFRRHYTGFLVQQQNDRGGPTLTERLDCNGRAFRLVTPESSRILRLNREGFPTAGGDIFRFSFLSFSQTFY